MGIKKCYIKIILSGNSLIAINILLHTGNVNAELMNLKYNIIITIIESAVSSKVSSSLPYPGTRTSFGLSLKTSPFFVLYVPIVLFGLYELSAPII